MLLFQELSTSTVYQQKALGTFGFLYMAHLDEKDVRDFQELQINIREIEASSIELDIEQALLVAFAEVQPPLSPKQQHQLLIASAEIFPPLTEQQQRRVLHALVQLIPSLTVRQQRHLISGSDVIIPPLTTRQQEELYAASSEIITLTTKQEKQLLYASTQVRNCGRGGQPYAPCNLLTIIKSKFRPFFWGGTANLLSVGRLMRSIPGSRFDFRSRLELNSLCFRADQLGVVKNPSLTGSILAK